MNKSYIALGSALIALAGVTQAQTAPTATLAPLPASTDAAVLRTGTPVALKMREHLTTKEKNVRIGQRFQLEVAEPVTVGGQIVIPAGSPAVGEVTDVRNKGMWGKSGKINARILHVRVGDRVIRLTGQVDDKGTTGTGGVVAAVALLPVAGFFTTGTSANIPIGAPVSAFIDEDVPLAITRTAPAPLPVVVPAPQPAPAVMTVSQAK